jgi:hypothetical protein
MKSREIEEKRKKEKKNDFDYERRNQKTIDDRSDTILNF